MQSLTAHLIAQGDHGRLPFHPDCPVCRRDRLAGFLPAEPVVSRRAQAAIAAGVLAVSSGAPTMAVAVEPDQQQEGTATPEDTPGNAAQGPDFDPGGESTDLAEEAPPVPEIQAPADPDDEAAGPLEQEPTTDTSQPLNDNPDSVPTDGESQPPAPPQPAEPTPTPPSEDPAPPAADPAPTSTPTPTAEPDAAPAEDGRRARSERRTTRRQPRHTQAGELLRTVVPRPVAPAPAPARPTTPTPARPPQAVQAADSENAGVDVQSHVVREGESLWSIAGDLLGSSASAAEIAREVDRLWRLNAERIATGEPDLIMPGTRLQIR